MVDTHEIYKKTIETLFKKNLFDVILYLQMAI